MPDYDLTVIGSGTGGYVAAIHGARLGARVAILEQKDTEWGGTCLNWGAIPTKALIHGAEVFEAVRRAAEFGGGRRGRWAGARTLRRRGARI